MASEVRFRKEKERSLRQEMHRVFVELSRLIIDERTMDTKRPRAAAAADNASVPGAITAKVAIISSPLRGLFEKTVCNG